ncbi:N-acetyl-gamma-glutamyl-phosphate reductase [Desulfonatronospira thiodismutans ASO3-1]|uniref:N-acetyl-gamma-glutamyl-phosphate reductase n=1 Tax=Desulfonatronospira thiodismutans ASO3-1 TaxID=555779 RepID=D6SNV0_9BACT|nr:MULTISPECIES: N-acetyl-gamma-glutamyl-phosphate reductase [Desulfonatronospira]EFI34426.1 N-acetyl-gamma-glutamyl-phosphate reductase [Desulfonatronospira thiodismutans ASO3-1]RQD73088.1 MAG: N-acetyl-gamma-glutamyl-phosphate reductase [Desulfonatronospira sp. MSAO_Bac3]
MQKKNVAVVGVTGYTGMELIRILNVHPGFEIGAVTSRSEAGRALQELFPAMQGTRSGSIAVTFPDPELVARDCEIVFLAVPHGAAMDMAAAFLDQGSRVVDLSADFRLRDPGEYATWYGLEHGRQERLKEAVYGLPEIYREQIAAANLVANPGCYPSSVILALYPGLKKELFHAEGIIADSKSGTSGAGRVAKTGTLFCEVADSFRAYSLGSHRHTPEMEQELSLASGRDMRLSFSPHLVPMNRGILSTCYVDLRSSIQTEEIRKAYREFYKDSPWVRIMPEGVLPETRWVRGTMFCDLGFVHDQRTGRLIIVSCIDNLCRGASGQAVANANLMSGYDLDLGLDAAPLMP